VNIADVRHFDDIVDLQSFVTVPAPSFNVEAFRLQHGERSDEAFHGRAAQT
jgi:hypothetical protein